MKLKRKLLLFCIPLFGVLLTAYSPMASFSNAQAVVSVNDLRQAIVTELDRRISNYQKTLDSIQAVPVSANGGAGSFATDSQGGVATSTITCVTGTDTQTITAIGTGFSVAVTVSCGMQDTAKQHLQAVVDELKGIKDKITKTSLLAELKVLAQNVDAQYGLNQTAQAQAGMVQAIASMAGVLDKFKTMYSDVQSRVEALKECLAHTAGSSSASSSTAPRITDPAKQCEGVEAHFTQAYIDQSQATLDSLAVTISSMTATLSSAISLLNVLADNFEKVLKGLGDKGILDNLGNISSMTTGSGLSALQGTLGSMNGQLGALSSISSQLTTTRGMVTSTSDSILTLAESVTLVPLTINL